MSIKTILVHLNAEPQAADLMGVAASIAEVSSAHLIGLHVVPDAYIPAAVPPEVVGELMDSQRQANEAAAAKIEAHYRQAVAGLRVAAEWRKVQARFESIADVVIRHGRAVDLVVLGQSEQKLDIFSGIDTSEEVMLRVGRPVLMVPLKGKNGPIGKRILIAWKDKREAARAVFDALPFLEGAEAVHILTVTAPKGHDKGAAVPHAIPAADIAATLAHHDVRCEIIETVAEDSTVFDEILNQIRERRCDMVVMGGYGHSRLREIVFGGTTRGMFDEMTVPVLMSH